MKSPLFLEHIRGSIEPLEARIAPARIIVTGVPDSFPNTVRDTNYTAGGSNPSALFVNTELALGASDGIADPVGGGVLGVKDTFYLRLGTGDRLQVFNQGGNSAEDYLIVTKGNLVAFFVDKDLDNEVDAGELVSLSLGAATNFVLKAGLDGDIVTNLDENRTTRIDDDRIAISGLVSTGQRINGLQVGGGVSGSILAGGNINNVTVTGPVRTALAGTAANGAAFDFFPGIVTNSDPLLGPISEGGEGVITFSQPAGVIGSSITNFSVDEVTTLQAGDGGLGAPGGSVTFVQIAEDANGMILRAGNGGGTDATRKDAGRGGSLDKIYVAGAADSVANELIEVRAGFGGASTVGNGGRGGAVQTVFIGYELVGSAPFASGNLLADSVVIAAGEGGDGRFGGLGGVATGVRVLVSTPDANGEEVQVLGGLGGDNIVLSAGRTGAGGGVSSIVVENRAPVGGSGILIDAGDGGNSAGAALGAVGGSIASVTLLGTNLKILAGDGSAGKVGGVGGSLSNIVVKEGANVLARNATFNAGFGGDGLGGAGGRGGNVDAVTVQNGDFGVLEINAGAAANGGNGATGIGGSGGVVRDIDLFDGRIGGGTEGLLNLRGGNGGDGSTGGGAGGFFTRLKVVSLDMIVDVKAGSGGDGRDLSNSQPLAFGGVGGAITTAEILTEGSFGPTPVTSTLLGGVGGDGRLGGNGGLLRGVSVRVDGDGSMVAGDGGDGLNKAGGVGASIISSGLFSGGKGELIAGNAGLLGGAPAAGGGVRGTSDTPTGLYTTQALTVKAGNGSHGGAGGSIVYVGYGSTSSTLVPTPAGNILIQAGDGSAGTGVSGVGGSITYLSGSVSSLVGATTKILAGAGGASDKTSSAGGSISTVVIERGGNQNVELILRAGDAGDSVNAAKGARGGSVGVVSVSGIDPLTIFRSVAAGDGGNARQDGGLGGAVANLNVLDHEIGVRSGEVFGYDTMGGVFAGAGGTGAKTHGKSGNVTTVNADAIASIVAGKSLTPESVETVDFISVNRLNHVLKESTGALQRGFPNATVEYTFGGQKSTPVSPNATATELGIILNAIPTITTAGGVTVTGSAALGYDITFTATGDKAPITGEEFVNIPSIENLPGQFVILVTEDRQGDDAPPAQEVQSFIIDPTTDFTVSYGIDTDDDGLPDMFSNTAQLAPTTTASQLEAALNALATITTDGGVTVGFDAPTNKFIVSFVTFADHRLMDVTGQREEIQRLDFYKAGEFSIEFLNERTARLPFNASAQQVQDALNQLDTIKGLAQGNTGSVTVTGLANEAFDIKFNVRGDRPGLVSTQFVQVAAQTVTEGTALVSEVQKLTVSTPILFDAGQVAAGAFVGAFQDVQAFNGPTFRFIDSIAGVLSNGRFDIGEQPIDGLIIAKRMNPFHLNFTPEARVVNGVFYDFNNQI